LARFVLADASPIIGLSRVGGGLALLERLFGQVHITRQVRRDVLPGTGKPGELEISQALDSGILRVLNRDWPEPQFPWLHDGEASTLRAAINLRRPCLVLIDEREARKTLRSLASDTIGVSGTIAVVGAAKQRGLIPSARAVFEELQRKNFYVSRALVAGILESTGEARISPVAAPKSSTGPQRAKKRRRRK